jgi:predicted ATPase
MITKLKVSNFKSLRELECEFGRLTVIVGPNGCGKSSVLQAVETVRDLVFALEKGRDWPDFPPSKSLSDTVPPKLVEFELESEAGFIFSGSVDNTRQRDSIVYLQPGQEPRVLYLESRTGQRPTRCPGLLEWATHTKLYQLDKSIMDRPAYAHEPNPVLGKRGEDLPAVLDALQGERREHFVAIEDGVRKFIPGLRRIRLHRVRVPTSAQSQAVGHQVVFDFEFAPGVEANHASEGTILLLGLLTVIGVEPGPPTTIMLDDLDRGLHPKAQKQLIEHLRKLLDSRPDLQIIATTHSPYLVEHLKYEEVLAMTQSPIDGRSLISPLAKHPEADRWRDEMSAGEFWSSVGEEWIRS